ncbi:hypothetical protein [Agromyces bauzanensis]|uniref:Ribbon-helix-helix protein, CopG family n=1 Tax=Agromyces bauzanensis TaxID=1308924 RepID=A0A917UXX3_9MICO|nr:hypothetical protein [Agromyces bauzanensis]GGJ94383.1 hypothetical protein GCM10011372_35870 [Agromyces bauzanensis]
MAAHTIGFAVADEDRARLDALVERFGHGNRSEFLRVAMRRMQHDLFAERVQLIQQRGRRDMGGRVLSPDEVRELVENVVREEVAD